LFLTAIIFKTDKNKNVSKHNIKMGWGWNHFVVNYFVIISKLIINNQLPKTILQMNKAARSPAISPINPAGTACLVFFIPTAPKYTAIT